MRWLCTAYRPIGDRRSPTKFWKVHSALPSIRLKTDCMRKKLSWSGCSMAREVQPFRSSKVQGRREINPEEAEVPTRKDERQEGGAGLFGRIRHIGYSALD